MFQVQFAPPGGISGPVKSVSAAVSGRLFYKAKTHSWQKRPLPPFDLAGKKCVDSIGTSWTWAQKLANGDFKVKKYR